MHAGAKNAPPRHVLPPRLHCAGGMFNQACPPAAGGGLTRRRPRETSPDLEEQEGASEKERLTAPAELSSERSSSFRGHLHSPGEPANRGALEVQADISQAKYAKPREASSTSTSKSKLWTFIWVVLTAATLGYFAADTVAPHIYRVPAAALSDDPRLEAENQPRRDVLYRRDTLYNTSSFTVPGKLNVHFVAHSHQDLGWLKTYHEYFLGYNNQHAVSMTKHHQDLGTHSLITLQQSARD